MYMCYSISLIVSKVSDIYFVDIWLTVHRSITFLLLPTWYMNFLFIYTNYIKFHHMIRAQSAHLHEVNDANCTYAVSGIVTLYKWLSCATAKELHKTVICREWRYQRLHMYNLRRRPPDDGRIALETCRGI